MKKLIAIILFLASIQTLIAQTKNFLDIPYIETQASADTMVVPDRIYINILISEKDTKGKISVETLEKKMADKLTAIGIDIEKQLALTDIFSNYMNYFLKDQDILKAKIYILEVYDAQTAGKVIVGLESEGISNVKLVKLEYSRIEEIKQELRSRAITKARHNALAMTLPLDQKVGPAIYISDYDLGGYTNEHLTGRTAGVMIRGLKSLESKDSYESIAVEFEKIKIEVTINAKFKIE